MFTAWLSKMALPCDKIVRTKARIGRRCVINFKCIYCKNEWIYKKQENLNIISLYNYINYN